MLAKGVKRKRSEEEADVSTATPSSSLFSISVSKLHQSLQHVEPNLRHLVLVANTLRRIQEEMQPAAASGSQEALARGGPSADDSSFSGHGTVGNLPCTFQDTCRRPLSPQSLAPVDELLLTSMDVSVFSTILEDLSGMEDFGESLRPAPAQPEDGQFCSLNQEPQRTPHPCPGPVEILGPGGYLLEDGLEGIFEDIDTSMYDCELWSPTNLPSFKEAFSREEEERLDLEDLDYLMDVIVGAPDL